MPEFSVDVCTPFEWTESNTAASASSTSSVSYEHSGKGQWYFGMISISFCRVAKIQDGGRFVTKCFSGVESRCSGGLSFRKRLKVSVGLLSSYRLLVIDRNESISDV